jgi:hypothetical protein
MRATTHDRLDGGARGRAGVRRVTGGREEAFPSVHGAKSVKKRENTLRSSAVALQHA